MSSPAGQPAPDAAPTHVVWDDVFVDYDFGPHHPLRPLRLELTMALARGLGVLAAPRVRMVTPVPATDDLLELVHDPAYIAAVRTAPDDVVALAASGWSEDIAHGAFGLGSSDNPIFPRMHEASSLVVGATVQAAAAVWNGEALHAVNLAGGLHHAMRDRASGFCVYDDPAVAIAWLLAAGASRIAYLDVDAHHGDGVQAAFYGDPRVLTVSLHESGRTLFPGSGWPEDTGTGEGVGTAVNVALPAGTGDAGWLRAFDAVVPAVVRAFAPQVILSQHGCDSHALDPLAHLRLSLDGQRASYAAVHRLVHEVCGGRWIAVGGGGYEAAQVVPRAWTVLLGEAAGLDVRGATPLAWRSLVHERMDALAPTSLSDGGPASFRRWPVPPRAGEPDQPPDPDRELDGAGPAWATRPVDEPPGIAGAVDAAIEATRAAVFPAHGLDPEAPPD
jgi:acetoin utilization protein AcuC